MADLNQKPFVHYKKKTKHKMTHLKRGYITCLFCVICVVLPMRFVCFVFCLVLWLRSPVLFCACVVSCLSCVVLRMRFVCFVFCLVL